MILPPLVFPAVSQVFFLLTVTMECQMLHFNCYAEHHNAERRYAESLSVKVVLP
jgi:hypothetical protein